MNICEGCGHIFDDGEERRIQVIPGLTERVCPICGDYYVKAANCRECGDVFPSDELYYGACRKCLKKAITYDTAEQFLCHGNGELMDEFMFEVFYESDTPRHVSSKLHRAIIERFKQRVASDKMLSSPMYGREPEFLNALIDYIWDSNGEMGKEDFAEWLQQARNSTEQSARN